MPVTNYLTHSNNRTTVHGFEDIVGKPVRIRVHGDDSISLEQWPESDLSQCIYFNQETLNKSIVVEFFKKHGVFNTYFIKQGNIYYQVNQDNE